MDTSDKKKILDSTPKTDDKKEKSAKDEKKSRRLSATHHLHHREKSEDKQEDKHDKKYYKNKYQEENKLRLELGDVVKKLNTANEQFRKEIETLKLELNNATKVTHQKPEPVLFEKTPVTPDPVKPDPTVQPTVTATSYNESLSNTLGTLYSYVPSFSGITSKLPTMPKVFEPVPNHHDSVSKPKL